VPEIIIGHQDGWLRVLNVKGVEMPGWPRRMIVAGSNATSIDSTPAVADLDKNGRKEIIVGLGSSWNLHQQGGLLVLNTDGTVRCRFRTLDNQNMAAGTWGPDGYSEPVYTSPAVGDINGDGYPDIVFGSWDHHIYAVDRYCHKILDVDTEDTIWSSPALFDINHDGRKEIFIGNDQTAGGWDNWSGGEFRALQWTPFGPKTLWIRKIDDTIWSSPAIGDINNDGHIDVVVGGGHGYNRNDGKRVWAFDAVTGANVRGWPQNTNGATDSAPALGDLTGDGVPEVVAGSADGYIRAYHGNGTLMWATHLMFNHTTPGGPVAPPIIVDLNGDGHNDVAVGNNWGLFWLDGRTGHLIAEMDQFLAHSTAPAVANFGPNFGWRMVATGFSTPGHFTKFFEYTFPKPGVLAPWVMFRRDPSHEAGPIGKTMLPFVRS
jgi:hypothetical protein